MPTLSVARYVRHPPNVLYRLILDVESYPDFLPFCLRTRTIRREISHEKTTLISEMEVGFALFREKYTSEIVGDNQGKFIRVIALDGPFRIMQALWKFTELEGGMTKINFDLEYEFKSRMLEFAAGKVFDRVFRSMAAAFENRANVISRRVTI